MTIDELKEEIEKLKRIRVETFIYKDCECDFIETEEIEEDDGNYFRVDDVLELFKEEK